MAVRLINLHPAPLRVDLRGGGVLLLATGERSGALREELLYDNCHLAEWERAGWVQRIPARMSEVLADTAPAPKPAPARAKPGAKATVKTAVKTVARKAARPAARKKAAPARPAAKKTTPRKR